MSRNKSERQRKWDALVKRCPLLFPKGEFYFACGLGWHDILEELCLALEARIVKLPNDELYHLDGEGRRFKVEQIKEKYGTLRFYMDAYVDPTFDDLITAAEDKSAQTCEVCGEPGELRTLSWVQTLCDPHHEDVLTRSVRTQ